MRKDSDRIEEVREALAYYEDKVKEDHKALTPGFEVYRLMHCLEMAQHYRDKLDRLEVEQDVKDAFNGDGGDND